MYLFKSKADLLSFGLFNAFYAFLISAFLFTNVLIALPTDSPLFSETNSALVPGLGIFIATPLLFALITGIFWMFNINTKKATQDLTKYNPTKTTKTYLSFLTISLILHFILFQSLPVNELWQLGFLSLTLISIFFSIKISQKIYLALTLLPVEFIVSISDDELQDLSKSQNIQLHTSFNEIKDVLDEEEICEHYIKILLHKFSVPIAKSNWQIKDFAKHKYGFFMQCVDYTPAFLAPTDDDEIDNELFNTYVELEELQKSCENLNTIGDAEKDKFNELKNKIQSIKNKAFPTANTITNNTQDLSFNHDERANSIETNAGYLTSSNNENGASNKNALPHKFHFYLSWHRGHSLILLLSVGFLPTPLDIANLIKSNNPTLNIQIIKG